MIAHWTNHCIVTPISNCLNNHFELFVLEFRRSCLDAIKDNDLDTDGISQLVG